MDIQEKEAYNYYLVAYHQNVIRAVVTVSSNHDQGEVYNIMW